MNSNYYALTMIGIIALVTAVLRFLPFLVFNGSRPVPKIITYLGSVLPYSIMAMLVVYCLKDVKLTAAPFGIPELLGCAIVAGLHLWKRSTLLSIGAGTVCYMLMVQYLF